MKKLCLHIAILLVFFHCNILAYDDKSTHPQLTDAAIEKSIINNFLISNLGIQHGVLEKYNGKTVTELIHNGSTNEDLDSRVLNHFWNPLSLASSRPRNGGLDDILIGYSNKDWAMGGFYDCSTSGGHESDCSCNDYSWKVARNEFYDALTSTTETSRNLHFKNTCESLGRILHLIEDMGVPAHTRNDFVGHLDYTRLLHWYHIFNPKNYLGNLYEYRVKCNAEDDSSYIPGLASSVTIPSFDSPQEYWGNGIYNGSNPEITITGSAGLAEYTNANFLSRYTIFTNTLPQEDKHYFPYPNETSVSSLAFTPHIVTAEDGKIDQVLHLKKDKHGESFDNFVGAKYVWYRLYEKNTLVDYTLALFLDDPVHDAYAEKLIPKTIGYSAGLINHFFRGTLELSLPDSGVYAVRNTQPSEPTTQGFNRVSLMVKNSTGTGEKLLGGTVTLVIQYKLLTDDPNAPDPRIGAKNPLIIYEPPYPRYSRDMFIVKGRNVGSDEIRSDIPVQLDFDLDTDIPLWAVDVRINVVYQGKLGRDNHYIENDAVCVGFKDISEPTPVDIGNNTDTACMNNVWYDLKDPQQRQNLSQVIEYVCHDLTEEPPGDWESLYIRFTPSDSYEEDPPARFDYMITSIPPGHYKRLFVLSDRQFRIWTSSLSNDPICNTDVIPALVNGPALSNEQMIWKFRGVEGWFFYDLIDPCASICTLDTGECPGCDSENNPFPFVRMP